MAQQKSAKLTPGHFSILAFSAQHIFAEVEEISKANLRTLWVSSNKQHVRDSMTVYLSPLDLFAFVCPCVCARMCVNVVHLIV